MNRIAQRLESEVKEEGASECIRYTSLLMRPLGWLQIQPAIDVADFSSPYQSARTTIR